MRRLKSVFHFYRKPFQIFALVGIISLFVHLCILRHLDYGNKTHLNFSKLQVVSKAAFNEEIYDEEHKIVHRNIKEDNHDEEYDEIVDRNIKKESHHEEHYNTFDPNIKKENHAEEHHDIVNRNMKKILFWIPFRKYGDYTFGVGHTPFIRAKCKVPNCSTTTDRNEVKEADALIFHIPQLRRNPLPTIRLPHQFYVFFLRESPPHSKIDVNKFNNFFNISMTFTRDTDVRFPFGRIEKRQNESYIPYTEAILTSKSENKFALVLTSHCSTKGRRHEIIRELKKYIPVDDFGKCGKMKNKRPRCVRVFNETCTRNTISEYKFYLAFENSLCRDYLSEKVYKVLSLPLIPVVYGGANYSSILPPKSFINVFDFKNVSSLVAYLKYVASNTEEYLSYFSWRKDYYQALNINMANHFIQFDPRVMCDLCEYLHKNENKTKIISNLPSFWGIKENCIDPDEWLKKFLSK